MVIKILLKSPDAVYEAVREAAFADLKKDDPDLAPSMGQVTARVDELFAGPLAKWIQYREYITVEIDTEKGTAIVCEQG